LSQSTIVAEGGTLTSPDAPTPWQTEASSASGRLLPPGLVFSDTPSRLMAYLLDGFVIAPLYYVAFALVGLDANSVGFGRFPDRNLYVLATLIGLAIQGAYFVSFWSGGRRATPGQRVFGIQVANAFDGQPLTIGQAFGRWAAMGSWIAIPFVLPIMAAAIVSAVAVAVWNMLLLMSTIVSPTKQGLHDRFARSALVRPAGAGNRWAVGCLTFLIILAALYVGFLVFVFSQIPWDRMPPNPYLDEYLRWMWPS
jgi:uncharacterized RDD family membrane protein YckC